MYWTLNKETKEPQFHTNLKLACASTDFTYNQLINVFTRKQLTEAENEKFFIQKEDDIATIMKNYAEKVNPQLQYVGDFGVRVEDGVQNMKLFCVVEKQ